jgi:hypothetical protein
MRVYLGWSWESTTGPTRAKNLLDSNWLTSENVLPIVSWRKAVCPLDAKTGRCPMRSSGALLAVAVCAFWPAISSAGGNLRGTVVLPAHAADSAGPAATCFWRLGPVHPAETTRVLPSVVLEGPAAAEFALDATAAPPELRFEGYGIWPPALVVPKGSKVLLRNRDDREYQCKASGGPEPLGLEKLGPGESKQLSLLLPGTHELRCENYPFMQARIVVAPSPLLTRVEEGDKFSFTNIPAGKYTARVYVDGAWQLEREVEIINLGTARLELASGQAAAPAVDADKPEPTEVDKPTPVEADKPTPKHPEAAKPEPKPADVDKPKPVGADKPKPTEVDKPKPVEADKPKPVEADKPKPVEADKPKPKPKPDKPKKPDAEPAFKDVEPEIEIETE